jgi:hypothetical protein
MLEIRDKTNLASTTRYFRSISPLPTHKDFLAAEKYTWARMRQLYACRGCIGFYRWDAFADAMRKGKRCGGGAEAHARLCLRCGVDGALYGPGTHVTICSRLYVLCSVCKNLTDQVGDHGVCVACSPDSRQSYTRLQHTGNDHFDHDNGWPYATEGSFDQNHSRDHFMWPQG